MTIKLKVNKDYWDDEESRIGYVLSRLGGKAAKQTYSRQEVGTHDPFLRNRHRDNHRWGAAYLQDRSGRNPGYIFLDQTGDPHVERLSTGDEFAAQRVLLKE
ncbi:hypothetical protein BDR22DRAFT_822253 [Usnea florida]